MCAARLDIPSSIGVPARIETNMRKLIVLAAAVLIMAGCSPEKSNPDAIREQTAHATAAATKDAKAVVQGVFQGLKEKGPININKASADDLKSLPGIDDAAAQKIIDNRPYVESSELVKRHVISRAEYNQIAGKVKAR